MFQILKRLWSKRDRLDTSQDRKAENCPYCGRLGLGYKITLPGELSETISILKEMVNHNELMEVPNAKDMIQKYNKPFSRLSSRGKWSDHVVYDFKCTHCQDFFHLTVETYHGRGGELKRVGPELKYDRHGNTFA